MSKTNVSHTAPTARGSLPSYVTGFLTAIVLTLVAYFLAVRHVLAGNALVAALLGLAIVQLVVQLIFFLHIGAETRPRWRVITLFMAIVVILILIIGSIWIMYNLNYRMTPEQINTYIQNQDNSGL